MKIHNNSHNKPKTNQPLSDDQMFDMLLLQMEIGAETINRLSKKMCNQTTEPKKSLKIIYSKFREATREI